MMKLLIFFVVKFIKLGYNGVINLGYDEIY